MPWRAAVAAIAGLAVLVLSTPASADVLPPRTVVSFTFDDGLARQVRAADILARHGMAGTFYIKSGSIDQPGYMRLAQLKHLQATGHEIGGHTVNHRSLTALSAAEVESEVCGDRALLIGLGFPVTDFAYPFGEYDQTVARVVRECGYNSARAASGLYGGLSTCTLCPVTESLGPRAENWTIRTSRSIRRGDTLRYLKSLVLRAEAEGGWLPIAFHQICRVWCDRSAIPRSEFTAFVVWMEARPPTTSVQTVQQVVGGKFQAAVGRPPEGLSVLPPLKAVARQNPPSGATAFSVRGYAVGQRQVIFGGILIAVVAVVGYRLSTRERRYVGR